MSDSLLHSDILAFLQAHASGAAHAKPRECLFQYCKGLGHTLRKDKHGDCRKLRHIYKDIDNLGSCAKGLFWIVTAEDRRIAGKQLHGRAMSELVREKRIKDAAPAGQLGLWEEAT